MIFPARVGMNPRLERYSLVGADFPRASGDEPAAYYAQPPLYVFSPREWG